MKLALKWVKCTSNQWCNLLTLNLQHEHFNDLEGVYVIWHGGKRWVRVGQGIIAERLSQHRQDQDVLKYKEQTLYVTWAEVNERYRDGVERYLGDKCNPLVGTRFPDVDPIEVNLPA